MNGRTKWISGRKALAGYLGLSVETIRRMEFAGMPTYQPTGGLIYDVEAVESWIRDHKVPSTRLKAF